jgi:hypothetical protein
MGNQWGRKRSSGDIVGYGVCELLIPDYRKTEGYGVCELLIPSYRKPVKGILVKEKPESLEPER